MNKTLVALKYASALVLTEGQHENKALAASFAAEMMNYGFAPSVELANVLVTLSEQQLAVLHQDVIPALAKIKGADVDYNPMYPNFPAQVMEASDAELFINAILHYWTAGEWTPEYEKMERPARIESVKFHTLGTIDEDGFKQIFTKILASNDSISEDDKAVVKWFLDTQEDLPYPATIPFKENMCYFAGLLMECGEDVSQVAGTATDILRICTVMSGGDVSLAENTKFKSLPRSQRKALTMALENVINEEDIARHRGKWIRLFHNLHVGEYSKKVFDIASKVRNNQTIPTFAGKVQHAIDTNDVRGAVALLKTRPGEFARRLSKLTRMSKRLAGFAAEEFAQVANQVPTRVLMQVLGHFQTRSKVVDKRVVFPKGNTQKALIVRGELPALDNKVLTVINDGISKALIERFGSLESLGKVWIDPELMDCPLPTQMRSASEGAFTVARGSRLPIGDKDTLRLFIYWKGRDIDLSATLHDENFNQVGHVSYTRLRNQEYEACHSGDITSAPNGASEFIDITMPGAVQSGARYVAMNVYVYAGPNFSDHEICYAGWMTREEVGSGEIYDPATVQQRVTLTAQSRMAIPVIFDMVERKAIWLDLATRSRDPFPRGCGFGGNNVENNKASIMDTMEAMALSADKASLYELFSLHAAARGEIVENREDADFVFSVDEGDITPYSVTSINADYLV
jgi:hypothetical protein